MIDLAIVITVGYGCSKFRGESRLAIQFLLTFLWDKFNHTRVEAVLEALRLKKAKWSLRKVRCKAASLSFGVAKDRLIK